MYYTYILYSKSINQYYTGQTQDVNRRLEEHNYGKTFYMDRGKPWVLVHSIEFKTRAEAMKMEKIIKKRGAARFLAENDISIG